MTDTSIFITLIPPIFAALIAYAIAHIKSNANERIQHSKIEAEVDGRVMEIVKSIVCDLKNELKEEIKKLREENEALKKIAEINKSEIHTLQNKLKESSELQDSMKIEIATLKKTIEWYEKRLKETENKNKE